MAEMLLVVRSFGSYRVGDFIVEAESMSDAVGGEHVHHVLRVAVPPAGSVQPEEF